MAHSPRVLVDFDGVLHAYSRGWDDGTAYDPPNPGAGEAVKAMQAAGYDVVVFSTRNADDIRAWLGRYDFPRGLEVTNQKLPAVAIIDDRAIRFTEWSTALADLLRLYPVRPNG